MLASCIKKMIEKNVKCSDLNLTSSSSYVSRPNHAISKMVRKHFFTKKC